MPRVPIDELRDFERNEIDRVSVSRFIEERYLYRIVKGILGLMNCCLTFGAESLSQGCDSTRHHLRSVPLL